MPPSFREKLDLYREILIKENRVRNIIGPSAAERPDSSLIEPSLALAEMIRGKKGVDVGSGNGLPGAVVAAARPETEIVLLDSSAKKINFLKKVKRDCFIDNIIPLRERAEKAGRKEEYREKFDFVLSRALAPLKVSCELCLPFAKVGGCYLVMSGREAETKTAEAEKSINTLGGFVDKITADGTIIIKKSSPTPGKYPRSWKKIR